MMDDQLIPNFYDSDVASSNLALRPGAIFEAPVLFVDSKLNLLKVQYVDPEHQKPAMLRLGQADQSSFKHSPVLELGLRDNEELAAVKCKRRPVVIFSQRVERWKLAGKERQTETCFCLPAFGLEDYDREFALSVRAFKYESTFYLPADKSFGIGESFIRFDRAQIVHCHHLRRWRPPVKLHDDALLMLQEWFRYYTTGQAEDWVLQHQKVELQKLERVFSSQDPGTVKQE